MGITDLTIVVCCNKKDFFFARICISSIRYYYPQVTIELVADPGNGYFDTTELETAFNVKIIDLGIKKLGWSGAKFHYLYAMQAGKKILLMDADIVFTGNFIERLLPQFESHDYLISIELVEDPYAKWVKEVYFDTKKIERHFPAYQYPGYFLNAGQIFITTGSINNAILNDFFDAGNYPFWKDPVLFPLVDQSVYNYLLPTLSATGKLKLATDEFMLWSKSKVVEELCLQDIKDGKLVCGLIHWAGDKRIESLNGMSRKDILTFFEKYYYSKVPLGNIKHPVRKGVALLKELPRDCYSQFKKMTGKLYKK